MAIMVKQPHGGAIRKLQKGESGNPKGRPKKFANILKPYGYTHNEILATLQNMQGMTLEQLQDIHKHSNATILERTIAKVLYNGLTKGDLSIYEQIWDRLFGKPKNVVEAEARVTNVVNKIETTDPQEAMRAYQKVMSV